MAHNTGFMFGVVVSLGVVFAAVAGAAPSLSSLSPDYGSGAGDTTVTIQGTGLSMGGVTKVLFGDAAASEVRVSDLGAGNFSLTCKAPPHWGGLSSVTVINPDLSSATLPDAYVFVPVTFDPAVTGALPCSSPTAGGRTIFVLGQEAGLPFSQYTLTIGGVPITGVREYRVPGCIPLYSGIAPAQPQGLVGFGVVGYGQLLGDCFIYSDWTGPLILSCSPGHDWDSGGAEVHIIAGNLPLTGTPTVAFGGVAAANVVVHPDFGGYITCTAPPHAAGMTDIVVTNPNGESGTLSGWFSYDSTQAPVLTSVTPNEGPGYLSYWVNITGSGFSPTGGTTHVTFGGVQATNVSVNSSTTLSCYTPVHDAGTVDVVVTNPAGNSGTLANAYTFLPPVTPTLASIAPNSGQEAGGTLVKITGTKIMSQIGPVQVSIGGVQVYDVHIEDAGDGTQRITCRTPAHAPGPVDVVVTNPGDAAATLVAAFTYLSQTPPNPVSVAPGEGGTLGGTEVVIAGTGFIPSQPMRVTFGGVEGISVWGDYDNTLHCTTPPSQTAGPVDVVVIAADDSSGTLVGGFVYVDSPPPRLDSVTPGQGLGTGGQSVTLTGAGFSASCGACPQTRVVFGGRESAYVQVFSESRISCATPFHAPGVVDIRVINPDGKTAELAGGFTYVEAPRPNPLTLSTDHGLTLGGTIVSISGSDFSISRYSPARVFFGGVEAPYVSVGQTTSIVCKTPAHAAGTVEVAVANPDGKVGVIPGGFTYLDTMPPGLLSVFPYNGFSIGGTDVTITATDLSEAGTTRVIFGGVEASDATVRDNGNGTFQVNCTTPPHAPGAVDVTVQNPGGGEATWAGGFVYFLGPPPVIAEVTPNTGPSNGGTPVLVSGYGIGKTGTIGLEFGGVAATGVRHVAGDTLLCILPPHAAGTVDVTLINTDGQTGTLPNAFTYRPSGRTVFRVAAANPLRMEDGRSWDTAFSTIQAGIDAVTATGEPGEVWVAKGNYTAMGDTVIALAPFCDVYGGFAGTETARDQRDFRKYPSTIDGEDVRACVWGADNARLDGFVVTRGNGPGQLGGGSVLAMLMSTMGAYADPAHLLAVDNSAVSPVIANCSFTGNTAKLAAVVNMSDLYLSSCPLITGCSFGDNGSSSYALINLSDYGSLTCAKIAESSFTRNWVGILNFGVNGESCRTELSGCTFAANTDAAVMDVGWQGTCATRMENCLFTEHKRHVLESGGMYPTSLDAVNCTFAGNPTAKDIVGFYYYGGNSPHARLTNCIVWGNGGPLATQMSSVRVSHSDVEGGYPGTDSIDADPLFVNPESGNYQVQPGSPCVDRGTADGAPAVDLLGVTRPQRGGFDMGAYELPDPVPAPDVVGLSQDQAAETLNGAGFPVGRVGYDYSLDTPAGVVLRQSPEAGYRVLPGSSIDLVLSRGGLAVPDVVGKPQVAAIAALDNVSLLAGAITEQFTTTVPEGTVLGQRPSAGTFLLPGGLVDMVVSRGAQPILMPGVVGQPQAQAQAAVTAAGLALGSIVHSFSDTVTAGTVISQSPAPGVELPPGTVVSIVVSLGAVPPRHEGEPEALDIDEAGRLLTAAFRAADGNGDGKLSFVESAAALPGLTQALFDSLDTNGDGQLTPGELGNETFSGCTGNRDIKSIPNLVGVGKSLGDLLRSVSGALNSVTVEVLCRP